MGDRRLLLSHTIVSMLIVWLEILIISKFIYKKFNKLSFDYLKSTANLTAFGQILEKRF